MIIPLHPDVTGASAELKAWVAQQNRTLQITPKVDANVSSIASAANLQKFTQQIGAVKSMFDGVNKSVGLINEGTMKSVENTTSLTAAGAQMAGPWGALAGFLAGGAIDLWKWSEAADKINISSGAISKETGYAAANIHEAWDNARNAAEATTPMVDHWRLVAGYAKDAAEWAAATAKAQEDMARGAVSLESFFKATEKSEAPKKSAIELKEAWEDARKAASDLYITRSYTEEEALAAVEKATEAQREYEASISKTTVAIKKQSEASATITGPLIYIDKDKIAQMETLSEQVAGRLAADEAEAYTMRLRANESFQASLSAAHDKHANEQAAAQEKALAASAARYEQAGANVLNITGTLGAQLEQNIAQGNRALAGMGAALEGAVGDILKAKGKEWSVKAIGELAEGLALLGSPLPGARELAGAKFASAATYGVAAAAAGVGGAIVGGDASRRQSAAGGGGGSAAESATSAGRVTDPGTTQLAPIIINFSSTVPLTQRQQQEAWANIQRLRPK